MADLIPLFIIMMRQKFEYGGIKKCEDISKRKTMLRMTIMTIKSRVIRLTATTITSWVRTAIYPTCIWNIFLLRSTFWLWRYHHFEAVFGVAKNALKCLRAAGKEQEGEGMGTGVCRKFKFWLWNWSFHMRLEEHTIGTGLHHAKFKSCTSCVMLQLLK